MRVSKIIETKGFSLRNLLNFKKLQFNKLISKNSTIYNGNNICEELEED